MMAVYSGTSFADPDNFLWQAYHSSEAGFWAAASQYQNPGFDKILEDARSARPRPSVSNSTTRRRRCSSPTRSRSGASPSSPA